MKVGGGGRRVVTRDQLRHEAEEDMKVTSK